MKLTRRAEYAIRTAVDLASQPPGQSTLSREIAERQEIPANFMVHVVGDLVRTRIVHAARGSGGGVSLAMPASEINVRQIVEAVEGPIALNKCLLGHDSCERRPGCPVAAVWERAQSSLAGVLEGTTLADLVAVSTGTAVDKESAG
ncbi:MAG: Rrf2 family transcriptional regulator [Actinobacteria bacterium]|nr:Rrf2 family transcriptional regulator [Actinomycetota bacterium]